MLQHRIHDPAAITSPLSAGSSNAGRAEAKTSLRGAPLASSGDKLLIDDHALGRVGELSVRKYDPEQQRSRLAPRAGTAKRLIRHGATTPGRRT
jgi:hypothetical protein